MENEISNLKIHTLKESGHNQYMVKASKEECELVRKFFDALKKSENCQVIYRGESVERAYQHYNLNDESKKNPCVLASYAFVIGEKAKSATRLKLSSKERSFRNVEQEIFDEIFDEIEPHELHIQDIENPQFSLCNKDDFIKKVMSISSTDNKVLVRNYYLYILHRIGNDGDRRNDYYDKKSHFLSTTTNYSVAEDYSLAEDFSEYGFIYVGWIPNSIPNRAMNEETFNKVKLILKEFELPLLEKELYPNDEEISLIGGIFPNFLLGIINVEEETFIINPSLFEIENLCLAVDEVIMRGLPVNQENFFQFLKSIGYESYNETSPDDPNHIKNKEV